MDFFEFQRQIKDRMRAKRERIDFLYSQSSNLDAVINFKVNSEVKSEFDKYCKRNNSSMSREFKNFMLMCIKKD